MKNNNRRLQLKCLLTYRRCVEFITIKMTRNPLWEHMWKLSQRLRVFTGRDSLVTSVW